MPTDGDSKTSSDPQRPRQGWLAKCVSVFPILPVRERNGSPEGPNRPVMTVADSSPKKRKRAFSPVPNRKLPLHLGDSKDIKMLSRETTTTEPTDKILTATEFFTAALKDVADFEAYAAARDQVLKAEEADSWDGKAKPKPTSRAKDAVTERRADIIIRAIREYERKVTFGNIASEDLPGPDTLDMGGQFLTNKARIDKESKLYEIAKMVPKGALLHLHFNAELHPELLLKQAQEMPAMYIRSIRPLITQEDLDVTEMVFCVLDPDKVVPNVNIFSPDYPGKPMRPKAAEKVYDIWMLWSAFRNEFAKKPFSKLYKQREDTIFMESPTSCAEPGQVSLDPAENWLKSKMVLSEKEAYGFTQTVNGVWARFNQATRAFKGLLNYEQVYKWYISQAIDRMIEEKVMYAELRPMLLDKEIPTNDGKSVILNSGQMQLIVDGVAAKQADLKSKGQEDKFPFGLKIIYCTPRSIPKWMMQDEMRDCITLKEKFPELICGFDLVGAEDRINHIGHYREELIAFRKTCEAKNLDIPFLFHAGETLLDMGGSDDPINSNLYDAVLLNSKRIGHGFALMKHPHLVEKFKKTETSPGICIELCPISNELLHLCRNIKEHPFPELLAAGIPCTVNSDNPSLFSNSMSHEFYQIMVGAPTISLYSWKQLTRWSIEYSCLSDAQKAKGRTILDESWKAFCKQVLKIYEPIMDGDKVNHVKAMDFYPKRLATS